MDTQNNALSLKRLPLAATGFAILRHEDQICIDKTKIIFDFANLSTPCFLARSRRFGKSKVNFTRHIHSTYHVDLTRVMG